MALVKKESSPQRTLILISILIAALLVALYYLVIQPAIQSNTTGAGSTSASGQRNRDLRALDERLVPDLQGLLADPRFQDLKQYGDVRIDVAPQGKVNPFQPF